MAINLRLMVILSVIAAAVVMMAHSAFAVSESGTPGWGYGDQNHVHVGPPGQSDRPNTNVK